MCRRGFPESLGRQFGGLPSPWGVLRGQVSRGRVYRGRCAESFPEEESTGVVAQKTLPGKSLGVIIRHTCSVLYC